MCTVGGARGQFEIQELLHALCMRHNVSSHCCIRVWQYKPALSLHTHACTNSHGNVCIKFYARKWSRLHTNGVFSCTYTDTHLPLYTSGREWNSKAKSPCHICRSSPIQWHRRRCPRMHLASEQLTCPPAYLPPSRAPM